MTTASGPMVGEWYKTPEGEIFEVVALDEADGTIDIQYFSGDVAELEMESWFDMELEETVQPEDWSGPFDDLVADDFGDTERPKNPNDRNNPLDAVEWED